MGLFARKPKIAVCAVCDEPEGGCAGPSAHVVRVTDSAPTWLPPGWRAQAQGEYTFLCLQCDSFPAVKWPGLGGAEAGLDSHLSTEHRRGPMKDYALHLPRIEMKRVSA